MKNTMLKKLERVAAVIGIANSEYVHDATGKIVGGKAPNAKPLREFYKKRDKFLRLRKKR